MQNNRDLLKKEAKAVFKEFYLKKLAAYMLAKAIVSIKK
jgi:hypothetical protein